MERLRHTTQLIDGNDLQDSIFYLFQGQGDMEILFDLLRVKKFNLFIRKTVRCKTIDNRILDREASPLGADVQRKHHIVTQYFLDIDCHRKSAGNDSPYHCFVFSGIININFHRMEPWLRADNTRLCCSVQ